jgi:hypothetical protein
MSSTELYDSIRERGLERLRSGDALIDGWLGGKERDPRRGLSLIIPLKRALVPYGRLVEAFSSIDPGQYYYPTEDLHITIFDFLRARPGYVGDGRSEGAFLAVAGEVLASFGPFPIEMRGVAFSQEAGLIAGYDSDALVAVRASIRKLMADRGLANDERYESRSAHATFVRFKRAPSNPSALCETIIRMRDFELGAVTVDSAELVEHDWYNSSRTKRVIAAVGLDGRRRP